MALDARSAEKSDQETNVGNFIADAFRKSTAADIGLMNGGSIRADAIIGPGRLTMRDLLSILPFKNKLVKIEVTGATLRAALEHGVSRSAEDARARTLSAGLGSSVFFRRDVATPARRMVDVKVNGQPLDDTKKYTLTTTTFVALDGGDGYAMFKGATVITST